MEQNFVNEQQSPNVSSKVNERFFLCECNSEALLCTRFMDDNDFECRKMNPNVEAMIQVVANTQKGSNRNVQKIPYTLFSSQEELNKFLEAI